MVAGIVLLCPLHVFQLFALGGALVSGPIINRLTFEYLRVSVAPDVCRHSHFWK